MGGLVSGWVSVSGSGGRVFRRRSRVGLSTVVVAVAFFWFNDYVV